MRMDLPPTVNDSPDEMLLKDIVLFFRKNWLVLLAFTIVGIAVAGIRQSMIPVSYEAKAIIRGASISIPGAPLPMDIEEPALIMARLKLDQIYTPEAVTACGLAKSPESASALANLVKSSTAKDLPNWIEIRIRRATPDLAKTCATAIYELIRQRQDKLLAPYVADTRAKILGLEQTIAARQKLLEQIEKSSTATPMQVFIREQNRNSVLEQITSSQEKIEGLKSNLLFYDNHRTQLIAPVTAPAAAVTRRTNFNLLFGLAIGVMLGILFIHAKRTYQSFQRE